MAPICTEISNLYLTCGGSSTLALIFEKFSCTEISNAWANGSFLKALLRDFKASLMRFCLKSGLTAVTLIIFLAASSPKIKKELVTNSVDRSGRHSYE